MTLPIAPRPPPSGEVIYSVKEILEGINKKLERSEILGEQLDKRTTSIEQRLGAHDKLLAEQLPKLNDFMEKMNVREQVAEELDARNLHGATGRDRFVIAAISVCLLIIGIVAAIPKVVGLG